jgi:L-arabinokinase
MYQSHASYSACGLGSSGTDELVRLARATGPEKGIFGAKITGGGSGGTVAILGRRDAEEAVLSIAAEYANISGQSPYVFQGSSPGAAAFGSMTLKRDG